MLEVVEAMPAHRMFQLWQEHVALLLRPCLIWLLCLLVPNGFGQAASQGRCLSYRHNSPGFDGNRLTSRQAAEAVTEPL